jgi:hypothetical protein
MYIEIGAKLGSSSHHLIYTAETLDSENGKCETSALRRR